MADTVAKSEVASPSKGGSLKISEDELKTAKERIFRMKKKARKENKKDSGDVIPLDGVPGKKKVSRRPVVFISHLPHGFYEEELRSFFTQFGQVCRVKVSRSKKTGNSKGYAFVEFSDDDVARIAAETMNNYLMFERLLKTKYIPAQRVHPKMFPSRWITPESYPALERRKIMLKKQEEKPTDEAVKKHRAQVVKSITRSLAVLKTLGIDDYLPLVYDPPRDAASFANRENKIETTTSEATAGNEEKTTEDKVKPDASQGKSAVDVVVPAVGTPVSKKLGKVAVKTPAKAPEVDSSASSQPTPAKVSKQTPAKPSNMTTVEAIKTPVQLPKVAKTPAKKVEESKSVQLTPAGIAKASNFKTPEASKLKSVVSGTPAKIPGKAASPVVKVTPAKTPIKTLGDTSNRATPGKTPSKEAAVPVATTVAATPERANNKSTPAKTPGSTVAVSQSPKPTPGKKANMATPNKTPAKDVNKIIVSSEVAPIETVVEMNSTDLEPEMNPSVKETVSVRTLAKSPAKTPKKVNTPKRVKEVTPATPKAIEKPTNKKINVTPKVEDKQAVQEPKPLTPAKSPKNVVVTPKISTKKEAESRTPNKPTPKAVVNGTPKAATVATTGASPSMISPKKRPAETDDNISPAKVAAIRTPVSVLKSPAGRVVVTPLSAEEGDVVMTPKSPAITPPARRLTRAAAKRMSMKISPKMDAIYSPRLTRKVAGTPSTPAGRRKSVKP